MAWGLVVLVEPGVERLPNSGVFGLLVSEPGAQDHALFLILSLLGPRSRLGPWNRLGPR